MPDPLQRHDGNMQLPQFLPITEDKPVAVRCTLSTYLFTLVAGLLGAIPAQADFFSPFAADSERASGKFVRLEADGGEPRAREFATDGYPADVYPASDYESEVFETSCDVCQGWYISLSGGVQSRQTVHEVGNTNTFLTFDDGFAANMAVGHQWNWFRWDFEYSLFNNPVETAGAGVPGVGNFVGDAVGNVSVRAITLNGYYDRQLGQSCWKPYVGGGIGVMQSEINSLFPSFFPALGAATGGVNTTSDYELCYQIRAGMGYVLGPRTELFSGYRYFDAGQLTFAAPPFGVFHPDGATFHSFEFGLRVRF